MSQFQVSRGELELRTGKGVSHVDVPIIENSKLLIASSGSEIKVFNSEKGAELFSMDPFEGEMLGLVKLIPGSDELAVVASAESNHI